jgi:hypothetical protein
MVSWAGSTNTSSQAFYSSLSAVGMQIGAESRCRVQRQLEMMWVISPLARKREFDSGVVDMGEIIRFVSRSELERARLIREARAIYDSIFPPADSANEQREPRK